eukprot:g3290.t1
MSTRTRYALIFVFCVGAVNHDTVLPFLKSWYKHYFGRRKQIKPSTNEKMGKSDKVKKEKAVVEKTNRGKKEVKPAKPQAAPESPGKVSPQGVALEEAWAAVSKDDDGRNEAAPTRSDQGNDDSSEESESSSSDEGNGPGEYDKAVETNFTAAVEHVKTGNLNISNEDKLDLYGLFKQACIGPCNIKKPTSMFDYEKSYKWDAWNSRKSLSTLDAMKLYADKVSSLSPGWNDGKAPEASPQKSQPKKKAPSSIMAKSVSTMQHSVPAVDEWEGNDDIFQFANKGELDRVKAALGGSASAVDDVDENGMTALMWACDQDHFDVVKYLVEEKNAGLSRQDMDGQSALHYALPYKRLAYYLAEQGADVRLKDVDGVTPLEAAESSMMETEPEELLKRAKST